MAFGKKLAPPAPFNLADPSSLVKDRHFPLSDAALIPGFASDQKRSRAFRFTFGLRSPVSLKNSMDKFTSIQALRGVAALLVVIAHSSSRLPDLSPQTKGFWFAALGNLGVDLFFCISGFVITWATYSYQTGLKSANTFFSKRLIRIWPPYFIATLIWIFILWLTGGAPFEFPQTVVTILKSLFFIPLSGTPPFYGYSYLGVGWTLNYEMAFYLVFAFAIGAFRADVRIVSVATLFVFFVVMSRFAADPDPHWSSILDAHSALPLLEFCPTLSNPLCFLFVIGSVFALLARRWSFDNSRIGLLFLFLSIAWLAARFCLSEHGLTGSAIGILPTFAVIVMFLPTFDRHCPHSLVWLGEISYSLYLTHTISIFAFASAAFYFRYPSLAVGWAAALVSIPVSILGAWVFYAAIERPLTRFLKSRRTKPKSSSCDNTIAYQSPVTTCQTVR